MIITTLLANLAARKIWGWPGWLAAIVTIVFLIPDTSFFAAAMLKIPDGGWFPLVVAIAILLLMTSWAKGREVLSAVVGVRMLPVEKVIADIASGKVPQVRGTAVYLTGDESGTPLALLHNLKINRVVHERNLFLTVHGLEVPTVPDDQRIELHDLGQGFYRAIARFGFMEDPEVPRLMRLPELEAIGVKPSETTFVLSRNQLVPAKRPTLARWRRTLFMFLSRNAVGPDRFYRLPPNRVLELGMQIEV